MPERLLPSKIMKVMSKRMFEPFAALDRPMDRAIHLKGR